jgi:hypothetical protein
MVQIAVTQAPGLFKSWTAVHLRHAALGSEGLRASTVPGRDRDQLVAENLHGIRDAVIGDLGSTQDPGLQRGRGPTSTAEPVTAACTMAS